MDFINRLDQWVVNGSMHVINAGVAIRKGVMPISEGVSRAMHDVYSLEGLEKWSKAAIADLRLISFIPGVQGVFSECIKTLEAQKDLYYATKFIGSTAEFIRNPTLLTDSRRLLYGIGDWFELGKFLQKNKVVPFSMCTELSNKYGAVKLFNVRLDDIPVLGNVFERPKDLCIFLASTVECWYCYQIGTLEWRNVLKATSSFGKMLLITFGKHYNKMLWFAVIDVVTQNASLASIILKSHQERERRFNNP